MVHISNEEGGNVTWENNLSRYQKMIFDTAGYKFGMYSEPLEEVPNPDYGRFYSLLEAVNKLFMKRVCAFSIVSGGKNVK